MKKPKYKTILLLYLFALFVVFAVIERSYSAHTNNIIYEDKLAFEFGYGWKLVDNNSMIPIEIHEKLKIPTGEWYTISNTVPNQQSHSCNRILVTRGSMASIKIHCNGDELYNYDHMKGEHPNNLPGSMWHIVRIPAKYDGKKIEISFKSDTPDFSGIINPIYMGTKMAILYKLFNIYGGSLLIASMIFLVGLMLFLYYFVKKEKFEYDSLLYLALSVMLVGLWLITETKLMQFFSGNYFAVSKSTYIMLAVVLLPITLFFDSSYKKHHPSLAKYFVIASVANVIAITYLHVNGIVDYFYSLPSTLVLTLLLALYNFGSMIYEVTKHKNKQALYTLIPAIIPLFAGIVESVKLFHYNYFDAGITFQYGVLLYLAVLVIIALVNTSNYNTQYLEAQYFKELAFLDLLTGGNNRSAYNRDIDELCYKVDRLSHDDQDYLSGFYLIIFDINDLKYINDNYGHAEGDVAIQYAYNIISEAFYGADFNIYRIGGDEFACIITDRDADYIEFSLYSLVNISRKYSESKPFDIVLSSGYGYYCKNCWDSYDSFYNTVDKLMYANKIKIKSEKKLSENKLAQSSEILRGEL